MTFRERFQRAAAYAKVEWSPTAIGLSIGLRKQTVSRWMDQETRGEPSGANIFRIADRWKIDARWLATGEGDMIQKVMMEPGATYTPAAHQVAREFDDLHEPAREHVVNQLKFLAAAKQAADFPNALQHETSRVRKRTVGERIGRQEKKDRPKKR